MEYFAPLCDVLCAHVCPSTPEQAGQMVAAFKRVPDKLKRPMLCNESCTGPLDDLKRAEGIRFTSSPLIEAGWGFMTWSIREGRAVACRRDRVDGNGLNDDGFHPCFTKDDSPRAGLEFMRQVPRLTPPWAA